MHVQKSCISFFKKRIKIYLHGAFLDIIRNWNVHVNIISVVTLQGSKLQRFYVWNLFLKAARFVFCQLGHGRTNHLLWLWVGLSCGGRVKWPIGSLQWFQTGSTSRKNKQEDFKLNKRIIICENQCWVGSTKLILLIKFEHFYDAILYRMRAEEKSWGYFYTWDVLTVKFEADAFSFCFVCRVLLVKSFWSFWSRQKKVKVAGLNILRLLFLSLSLMALTLCMPVTHNANKRMMSSSDFWRQYLLFLMRSWRHWWELALVGGTTTTLLQSFNKNTFPLSLNLGILGLFLCESGIIVILSERKHTIHIKVNRTV